MTARRKRSAVWAFAALLAATAPALIGAARAGETPRAEIVAFGSYGPSPAYGSLAAKYRRDSIADVAVTAQPRLLERTDRIEARPCTRFGLQYRAGNLGDADSVLIDVRVEHPPLRRPDGRTSSVDTYEIPIGGAVRYTGFDFDEPWELVPGTWSFALVYGGRVLAEQRFAVVPAPGADASAGACLPAVS